MMKLKLKGANGQKIKLPKIEINECKGKTKDQKKLENEMFEQAREAKVVLEQLLNEDCYGEFGRARSNSLNATVENLLLSSKQDNRPKNFNKARGSVPIISNLPRKLLARNKQERQPSRSLPTSPFSPKRSKMNPLKYIYRKHTEQAVVEPSDESECWSPKTKRVFESTSVAKEMTTECTSFKAMTINE